MVMVKPLDDDDKPKPTTLRELAPSLSVVDEQAVKEQMELKGITEQALIELALTQKPLAQWRDGPVAALKYLVKHFRGKSTAAVDHHGLSVALGAEPLQVVDDGQHQPRCQKCGGGGYLSATEFCDCPMGRDVAKASARIEAEKAKAEDETGGRGCRREELMPRTCTVCQHEKLNEINAALLRSDSLRKISEFSGMSITALHRHKKDHLPMALVKAMEAAEEVEASTLFERLRSLNRETQAMLREARECGNNVIALGAESHRTQWCFEYVGHRNLAPFRSELNDMT